MRSSTLPDITVLLPVYNGEEFIADAVNSILGQTYSNFVLLIIDDGSLDDTGKILEEMAARDPRIRLVRRENRGLIATLNEGMAICRTELIARMDADDVALPTRLALQKNFMDANPNVAVCGTEVILYEKGSSVSYRTNAPFDVLCLFGSPLAHPTVMFRRSIVLKVGGYRASMLAAEDYDLWVRICQAGFCIANIPKKLLLYREHPNNSRRTYRRLQRKTTQLIWMKQISLLGINPSLRELDDHAYCAAPCHDISARQKRARRWLRKICLFNMKLRVYDPVLLENECIRIRESFPKPLAFMKSPFQYCLRSLRQLVAPILIKLK